MSTEWNNKLALSLRDPADAALDLPQVAALRTTLLESDAATSLPEADAHQSWLTSAADRVPSAFLAQAESAAQGWAASGEVTHPLSSERRSLGAVDLAALQAKTSALAAEAAKRFDDPRRRWLWVWRYLPDRLAADLGPAAHLVPADPRMPELSVWSRIGIDGALATASPSATFLVAHLEPAVFDASNPPSDAAYAASLRLQAHLAWQAALVIVEALGPDAVLAPSLRYHPLCDEWLGQQKVTAKKGDKAAAAPSYACFPSSFTALVPLARAAELGDACSARVREAWEEIASKALGKLARLGVSTKDKIFSAIWERQIATAWQPGWVAAPWLDDTTGAGGLLGKQDVSAHEKWARLQQDASGLDDPWPGVYHGLWYQAAAVASEARRLRMPRGRTIEPSPRCTSCGQREALHAGKGSDTAASAAELWSAVASADGGASLASAGEMLCACCAATRLWLDEAPAAKPEGDVVVVFSADQLAALRRGGKELRQGATMADLLSGALSEAAAKARGATKELLDSIPVLGPSRLASLEAALTTTALHTIPALVAEAGGTMLHAVADEQIALVPALRALELVQKVRARLRENFVEIGGRWAIQPGVSTTVSAALVIGEPGVALGRLVRAGRTQLSGLARETLGGDAVVIAVHGAAGEQQVLGLRGSEVQPLLSTLLASFPKPGDWSALVRALRPIQPALTNPDVDKGLADARALLVRDSLFRAGIRVNGAEMVSAEDTSRALCALIDRALVQADGDVQRAMDGLHVAARLAGGDR